MQGEQSTSQESGHTMTLWRHRLPHDESAMKIAGWGAGYLDHPFMDAGQKVTTTCNEGELVDLVCLSRWASCG
jgi:hypothetical protein